MKSETTFGASAYASADIHLFRDAIGIDRLLADFAVFQVEPGEILPAIVDGNALLYVVLTGVLSATMQVTPADIALGVAEISVAVFPGECVGAGSVMGGERRGVSIVATQPTEVLAIDGAGLLKLIDGSNGFAHRLLALQSSNARASGQQEMEDDFLSMMGNDSGLQDRAWLEEHLAAMTAQAQETNKPVSMLMISLDYIDHLVEWYDSSAAEEALDMTCGLIIESLRPTDFTVRYSDNELAVLLPAANAEGATTVAQRLSERMKTTVVFSDLQQPLPLSASFGVACLVPHQHERDLISASAAALMRAKSAGRYNVSL